MAVHLDIGHPLPSGLLIGQLGPDALPVVGAQVFAGDFAVGGLLNRRTVFGRHRLTLYPLRHSALARHARLGNFLLRASDGNGFSQRVHAAILNTVVFKSNYQRD